jgi:1,2-diacylglycerol-3-alpha-glucose alpha-1,2-galactosyltransferase
MPIINMRSAAFTVKGQGVGSCYEEHLALVRECLGEGFTVFENKNVKCDITHYHTVNFPYFIERFIKGKRTVSICFVHFLPETVDRSIRLPWIARIPFYKYLKVFYNSMDYLVAVNPSTIPKIAEAGITKPNICYIPNYVSEDNFFPLQADRRSGIRKRFDIKEDAFVVLGVGQLQTRKGVFDFFETAKRMPHIQFVWAGGFSFGKITDGYEEIRKTVDNPPENLSFLGIVERSEMNDIYNMCDLMFLPSFDELFPMSILEALACKKPVMLRDIDVYKTILDGYYVKGGEVGDFCGCIEKMASDRAEYDFWAEKAWECHLRYNKESIGQMWKSLYSCAYRRAVYDAAAFSEGN